MLIEFLKSIHKKYLNFFKFILFLRYLIAIFIVAITFFLLIPKTFDYRTKDQIIKNHLIKKYNLNIQNYNNIKYNIFPLPNLSINDLKINIVGEPIFLKVQNLNLFLELSDIYNFDSFNSKKIIVEKSYLNLDLKDIYKLIKIFHKLENKIEPISCSLQPKKMKLSELMNPNHVCEFENKKYIRMFHGTNSKHLTDILVNGLQLIGGGALGNGFYMTPSLVKAEQYNIKQQQKNCKLTPIVLELFLPMTTTVSAFPNIHDDANVYTEQNEFWQFVTKNESFLKKSICFNVFIYQ